MLELRKLNDSDIPLIEKWLNNEHVKKWYEIPHMGVTLDDWMMEIKGRDRDEKFGDLVVEGAYGIDYFIGEESNIGKGVGKQMIMALINKIFSLPGALRITADIDKSNKASEGTLLSCGFVLFDVVESRYVLEK